MGGGQLQTQNHLRHLYRHHAGKSLGGVDRSRVHETIFLWASRRVESDWKVGSPFRLWQPDGTLDIEGKVVEADRPRRLSVTWRVMWVEELKKLPDCLVTYQIDALGGLVRVTMTEAHQIELDEKMLEGGRRGWPVILCGLKSLLETGKALPAFDMSA